MGKRKYDDDAHRKLREKVARFRARHKARLAAEAQQRSLERGRRKMGRAERWRLFERIDLATGLPVDVVLIRVDADVPHGCFSSRWLPTQPVAWALALQLRRLRRQQLREWLSPRSKELEQPL